MENIQSVYRTASSGDPKDISVVVNLDNKNVFSNC